MARNKTEDRTKKQLPHLMVLHLKKKRILGKLTRSTQEIDETTDVDKDMEVDVDEKHELSYMEQGSLL